MAGFVSRVANVLLYPQAVLQIDMTSLRVVGVYMFIIMMSGRRENDGRRRIDMAMNAHKIHADEPR
jgi:hypothetical protein